MLQDYTEISRMSNLPDSKTKVGTVIDVVDPANIGRVKVSIANFDEDGSWAYIVSPASSNSGAGRITYNIPPVGSFVLCDVTNPYTILVTGVINSVANPLFDSADKYGFDDGSGTSLVVDRSTGDFTLSHSSGTVVSIDNAGVVTITSPSDVNVNAGADLNLDAVGDVTISGANVALDAAGIAVVDGGTQTQIKSDAVITLQSPVINSTP